MPSQYEKYLVETRLEADINDLIKRSKVPANAIYDAGSLNEQTVLMYACEHRQDIWTQCLLQNGADPNAKDFAEWTAVMYAVTAGDAKSLRLLIKAGANLNHRNNTGQNALGVAAEFNNFDLSCTRILLVCGVDIENRDDDNKTALDLVRNLPNEAKYVAEFNKKVLLQKFGNTLLIRAAIWGNEIDLADVSKQSFSSQEWSNALAAAKEARRDATFIAKLSKTKDQFYPPSNRLLTAKFWIDLITYPFKKLRDFIKSVQIKPAIASSKTSAAPVLEPEPYDTWKSEFPMLYALLHDWHLRLETDIKAAQAKNDQAAYSKLSQELSKYEQAWEQLWMPYSRKQPAAFRLAAMSLLDRLEKENKAPLFTTMPRNKTLLAGKRAQIDKSDTTAKQIDAVRRELEVGRP